VILDRTPQMTNYKKQKQIMVDQHLRGRDITDERVIQAMKKVPREEFVPDKLKSAAYSDHPLPIGQGQTISQPYIVALICQLLELDGSETVLDIGTGSGYQAAVLSHLGREVISLEIVPELAEKAKNTLQKLGYGNITVLEKDGKSGYQPKAPYQAIASAAATEKIPGAWKNQLDVGGILVLPLEGPVQKLLKVTKKDGELQREVVTYVRFVPLK